MSHFDQELCAAGAQLSALGLSPGTSGNISVRVGSEIHLSPSGTSLGQLDPAGLSILSMETDPAQHIAGPRPSKEFGLHEAFYRRDPGAVCVIHLHSTHAAAVSCLPAWAPHSALPPLTPYLLMRLGNLPLLPYHPPGSPEQAVELREIAFDCRGVLLQNHGPVVAGATVEEAIARAVEVEEAARTVLAVAHRADVVLLDDDQAEHLASRYGQPWGAEPVNR
ncbi:class II aldolase/adducin family protein [Ornithinimicrobium faecis]|uniref:class II aldolase/adducin family protein n=1 Tax=Ornithinimicrobium faecis TaxID=2934158 RepID=UPI0021180AB1|nr:class II aldolase/adducin family protein [Ornithinimicrobium sp. HY1745]